MSDVCEEKSMKPLDSSYPSSSSLGATEALGCKKTSFNIFYSELGTSLTLRFILKQNFN